MNDYYQRKSRSDSARIVNYCIWGFCILAVAYFGAHGLVAFFKSATYARMVFWIDTVGIPWWGLGIAFVVGFLVAIFFAKIRERKEFR